MTDPRHWLLILLVVVVAGCGYSSPPPQTFDMPEREPAEPVSTSDFDLGLRITLQAYRDVGVVDDDSLTAWVNDVGYRVASVVPQSYLFTFHVIDLPYPNAFALPGGFIFVTRGMLEMDLTEPELAALLGHEIAHVVKGHFSRSQRLSSILSLAEVALLVGVILAGDADGSATRYERQGDMVYQGSTGRTALLQGVPTFGGLFRTLVERKYGRSLEFESDELGGKLAAQAGYPATSAERMLARFKSRIHEETTYGYWLTHPFFKERVTRAAAMSRSLFVATEPPPSFTYRRTVQRELFRIANYREAEIEAAFLYQLALTAEPHGLTAIEAGREILRFRTKRDRKKKPMLRNPYPIIADYDSLLVEAGRVAAEPSFTSTMSAERDSLERERTRLLDQYLEKLDRDVRETGVLERFVVNYPDHPKLGEMRYHLARNLDRSGRTDEAAETYAEVLAAEGDSTWHSPASRHLTALLPRVESPLVLQELIDDGLPDSIAVAGRAVMDTLVTGVDSMETAAAFIEHHPTSEYAVPMAERLDEMAQQAFREARLLEGVAEAQRALDAYHRILFVAPESQAAQSARERIDHLVRVG